MDDETIICHSAYCNYETAEPISACPKCNGRMFTKAGYRQLGLYAVVLGSLLVIGGPVTGYVLSPPDVDLIPGGSFGKILALGVVVLISAIGAAIILAGIYQYKYGRADLLYIGLFVAFIEGIFIVAALTYFFY